MFYGLGIALRRGCIAFVFFGRGLRFIAAPWLFHGINTQHQNLSSAGILYHRYLIFNISSFFVLNPSTLGTEADSQSKSLPQILEFYPKQTMIWNREDRERADNSAHPRP